MTARQRAVNAVNARFDGDAGRYVGETAVDAIEAAGLRIVGPAHSVEPRIDLDVDTAVAVRQLVDARLGEVADRMTDGRLELPSDTCQSRQQWHPGPQPPEYGDERTAPPSL